MPDTSKLEKLNRELEKSEKKLRKALNDEKALQHQLKQLTRKERTHRLCTRGGMLESFLQEPERLTDDDVMLLLKLIFHRQDTQELLKKLLEREKPETGNVKKCAVGKYPKSEKHGNTAQFSEVERSGTQENCGGIESGCRLRLHPLSVLHGWQSQRVARIDPNAVVVDKNIAENDRFDLFSR